MIVAIVSLRGGPFIRGFFSKDLIIELRIGTSDLLYGMYVLEVLGFSLTS